MALPLSSFCLVYAYVLSVATVSAQSTSFSQASDPNPSCIPTDFAFFCTSLWRLQQMEDENGNSISTYFGLNYTFNDISYIYIYQRLATSTQFVCFPTPLNEPSNDRSLQYTLFNDSDTNSDIQPLAAITLNNIGYILPVKKYVSALCQTSYKKSKWQEQYLEQWEEQYAVDTKDSGQHAPFKDKFSNSLPSVWECTDIEQETSSSVSHSNTMICYD